MQPAANQAEPTIGAIEVPSTIGRAIAALLISILVFTYQPFDLIAQEPKELHGKVHDRLGDVVGAASVNLLADAQAIAIYLSNSARDELQITLPPQNVKQQVTVTATGTPIPEAQIGASITVLTSEDYRYMPEVQEPLRLIPGLQVTQSGQIGCTSGLSIRGGETTANKALIDGVPANTIGGGVEFANLATIGFGTTEVLREPNSALYGSDALAGVVIQCCDFPRDNMRQYIFR